MRGASLVGLIVSALDAPVAARADEPVTPPIDRPDAAPKAPLNAGHTRGLAEARSPGFETLADGSTRLSIEFSEPVTYDTKAASGRVVYVVKGARVGRRNDYNPLVTVAFNTPVTTARLVAHGRDLWFVVDLRAPVKPEVKTDAAKEGGVVLQIEFPKGDYVVAAPDLQPADAPAQAFESDRAADPSAASGADPAPRPASPRRRRSDH